VSVALQHILVDSREQARSIKQELENGADFTALAQKVSKDALTKNAGGALGYIRAGKAVLPIGRDLGFEQVVMAPNEGEIGIVETSMGWHVVKAEKKEGGDVKPLSEIHDQVAETLFSRQYQRVYNQELAKAREELDVRFNTENFEAFSGSSENTKRLMDLAITIAEPRALAFDFPDAAEAAEALFRMGHILVINQGDKVGAASAFRRITVRYPMSQWKDAANFMLENLDMTPEDFGSPEEILSLVKTDTHTK
jgi:TolA-binding protein